MLSDAYHAGTAAALSLKPEELSLGVDVGAVPSGYMDEIEDWAFTCGYWDVLKLLYPRDLLLKQKP